MMETEKINPKSQRLDEMSILEIVNLMNEEDAIIPIAIARESKNIAKVIEMAIETLKNGGRIFYVGAGTSGRLAVIDSVELFPTFSVTEELFIPIMAGGEGAFFKAIEGAEDDTNQAKKDFENKGATSKDMVIGITASGRTPYVGVILKEAKIKGCKTVLITNVSRSEYEDYADVSIKLLTGPEVLTGSTRLKAGTSQKMVLNMISTITMVKLGKVYKNYMVDLKVLNSKLKERAKRIVMEVLNINYNESEKILSEADYKPKLAILMYLSGKDKAKCEEALKKFPNINKALMYLNSSKK